MKFLKLFFKLSYMLIQKYFILTCIVFLEKIIFFRTRTIPQTKLYSTIKLIKLSTFYCTTGCNNAECNDIKFSNLPKFFKFQYHGYQTLYIIYFYPETIRKFRTLLK